MPLVCHEDPKDFYRVAVPLLVPQEAYNNMPLGLLLRLQQRPELVERALMLTLITGHSPDHSTGHSTGQNEDYKPDYKPDYSPDNSSDPNTVSGALVAVQTRPGQLVIGQSEGAEACLPELVDWMLEHRIRLQGLVAPEHLAREFARLWQARGGSPARIDMEQRVYCLQQVRPLPRPAGHYRLASLGDLSLVVDWIEAFISEALPHERPDHEGIRTTTLQQIEAGDIGLWELGEHPVSMAARTRRTLTGTSVSLVYTPPEQRGKGYAGACTAALSQAQLDTGLSFCCLFTDLANPTSNHIYQRIGYEPVGDLLVLDFSGTKA